MSSSIAVKQLCRWCGVSCNWERFVFGPGTESLGRYIKMADGCVQIMLDTRENHDEVLSALETSFVRIGALCHPATTVYAGKELVLDIDFKDNKREAAAAAQTVRELASWLLQEVFPYHPFLEIHSTCTVVRSSIFGYHIWVHPFVNASDMERIELVNAIKTAFPQLAEHLDIQPTLLGGWLTMPGSKRPKKLYAIISAITTEA